jgi:adenosine kinase
MLNVSFLVPGMRREFGGCAGNIAYTLKMLGGDPIVMATVGQDAEPYLHLRNLEIRTDHIRVLPETFTAQAMITTDLDNNQITAFHPGAMGQSQLNRAGRARHGQPPGSGIVAPDSREGMLHHAQQFAAEGIPSSSIWARPCRCSTARTCGSSLNLPAT